MRGGKCEEGGLSAILSGREGEEVDVDGLDAEGAGDYRRDAEEWHPVAGNRGPACVRGKTVVDPKLCVLFRFPFSCTVILKFARN